MKTIKKKSLFDHVRQVTSVQNPNYWDEISEEDKKSWSNYMVNRFLSMNMGLLELVNELQKFTIGQLSPRDVYKMYFDFLPKKKTWDKYIKGKKDDKYNSNVLEYLAKYYKVSQREVRDYIEILSKDDITEILLKYGLDKKEVKKWLK